MKSVEVYGVGVITPPFASDPFCFAHVIICDAVGFSIYCLVSVKDLNLSIILPTASPTSPKLAPAIFAIVLAD